MSKTEHNLEEAKLEKSFMKYQIALLDWNAKIKVKNDILKNRVDSMKNRLLLEDAHSLLSASYKVKEEARKIVDVAILEQHNIQQHWRNL